ncbi:BspA family leucine-rich repeat surface protein [Aquimarina addita]
MRLTLLLFIIPYTFLCITSCSSDDDKNSVLTVTIELLDFETTVIENQNQGFIIGSLETTIANSDQTPTYTIVEQSVSDAIILEGANLIINDATAFDLNTNTQITGQVSAMTEGVFDTASFTLTITNDPAAFITIWETTIPNEEISIYTDANFDYDYTIHWGDGTVATNQTGDATHIYTKPAMHKLSIVGKFPSIINSDDSANAAKLLTIENWGNIAWEHMFGAFENCINLKLNASDIPDLTSVTSMSRMFRNATSFNGDLSNWDVSNVYQFDSTFANASAFNGGISNWDISKATSMAFMFLGATSFNQDIGNWDVSNITRLESTFNGASSFNQNISNWDVSNVSNMSLLFKDATAFNQDISSWDVSNTIGMVRIFEGATSFNQDISNWDIGNIINMWAMFKNATSFNQDISNWDVSGVTSMLNLFENASTFNQDLSDWMTINVTNCTNFSNNSALTQANKPTAGDCDFTN